MILLFLCISMGLLFVPLELIALIWEEFGTWKFVLNLFTHQLGHAGLGHLFSNYMFMMAPALWLEYKVGWKKFCTIYFMSGLFGLLCQILVFGGSSLIGSSAAAFGVVAAACLYFNGSLFQKAVGSLWLLGNIALQFMMAALAMFSNIAVFAHLGGAIMGMYLAHVYMTEPKRVYSSSTSSKKES